MENNPILLLKEEIRKKASGQRILKLQRKTVHFEGVRTKEPWEACMLAGHNKYDLRHMYLAYGLLRGKTIEQIESSSKSQYSEKYVSELVDKYKPEAVRVSA